MTAYSYGGDVVFCVDVVVIWSAYSRAVVYVLTRVVMLCLWSVPVCWSGWSDQGLVPIDGADHALPTTIRYVYII